MEWRQRLLSIEQIGRGYNFYPSYDALRAQLVSELPKNAEGDSGALSRITMVGALQREENGKRYLHHDDALDLATFIQTAIAMGLPISSEFTVDVVNLKDGRDFLKETGPLEVVLFCYLYHNAQDISPPRGAKQTQAQSPLAHKENIWINRLENGGAKIVMARHDPDGAPNLCGTNFYNLLRRQSFLRLPNDAAEMQYDWHAQRAYWKTMRGVVNPQHPIVMGLNCKP